MYIHCCFRELSCVIFTDDQTQCKKSIKSDTSKGLENMHNIDQLNSEKVVQIFSIIFLLLIFAFKKGSDSSRNSHVRYSATGID